MYQNLDKQLIDSMMLQFVDQITQELLQVNVEKLETNFGHIVCSKMYNNMNMSPIYLQ